MQLLVLKVLLGLDCVHCLLAATDVAPRSSVHGAAALHWGPQQRRQHVVALHSKRDAKPKEELHDNSNNTTTPISDTTKIQS